MARLVPLPPGPPKRVPGLLKGQIWVSDDFDDPLGQRLQVHAATTQRFEIGHGQRFDVLDDERMIGAEPPHDFRHDDAFVTAEMLSHLRQVGGFRAQIEVLLNLGGERLAQFHIAGQAEPSMTGQIDSTDSMLDLWALDQSYCPYIQNIV